MIRLIGVLFGLMLAGGAQACPQVTSKTDALILDASDFATPRRAAVRAGGTVVLDACAVVPGTGHVPFAPTVVIDFDSNRRGRALAVHAAGGCDPVLLLRTARGNWYFDDDNGGGRAAQLVLANPAGGRYRIWVGSRNAFGCDAELTVASVRVPRGAR